MEQTILEHNSEYPKMSQFITQAIMLDEWELELVDVKEVEKMMRQIVKDEDFIYVDFTGDMFTDEPPFILSDWNIHFDGQRYSIYNYSHDSIHYIPKEHLVKFENILIGVHEYLIEEQNNRIKSAKEIKETEEELKTWSR